LRIGGTAQLLRSLFGSSGHSDRGRSGRGRPRSHASACLGRLVASLQETEPRPPNRICSNRASVPQPPFFVRVLGAPLLSAASAPCPVATISSIIVCTLRRGRGQHLDHLLCLGIGERRIGVAQTLLQLIHEVSLRERLLILLILIEAGVTQGRANAVIDVS